MLRNRRGNIVVNNCDISDKEKSIDEKEVEEYKEKNIDKKGFYQYNKEDKINYKDIDTLIFSSSELYILSILGYIDQLIINQNFNLNKIKNFVSSSLGTLVCVYISFGYTPKEILLIFFDYFKLKNDSILNIFDTFGIFDISYTIDTLLIPLFNKIGYIPTLEETYKLTNKNCIFVTYNLNKSKNVIISYKSHANIKINEAIKLCCVVPIIFKKYDKYNKYEIGEKNEDISENISDLFIDYSIIDNREEENIEDLIENSVFNKILKLKININKKENTYEKDVSVIEYMKQLYESMQEKEDYSDFPKTNVIELNINCYNKIIVLDEHKRYKEFINLYCFENDVNNIKEQTTLTQNLQVNYNYDKYEGIVFAGGGTNVFYLLGFIKYSLENNIFKLSDIDTLVGTSAGSYLCVLFAMGYTIEQMIKFYTTQNINEKLNIDYNHLNIIDRINEKSIYSNKIITELYEKVFIETNNGIIPTLLDIKNKYGKEVVIVTYNLTKNKLEYLNYKNYPDLLVTHACTMSSCIPVAFNPFEYNKCFYVDGGIKTNFPIEYTYKHLNKKFIGFGLNFSLNYNQLNLGDYLFYFVCENSRKNQLKKIKSSKNCDCYCLDVVYDDNREKKSLFSVDIYTVTRLVNQGFDYMKNNFRNNFKK
jgi:predicted acylesterase/phospholipase RssA